VGNGVQDPVIQAAGTLPRLIPPSMWSPLDGRSPLGTPVEVPIEVSDPTLPHIVAVPRSSSNMQCTWFLIESTRERTGKAGFRARLPTPPDRHFVCSRAERSCSTITVLRPCVAPRLPWSRCSSGPKALEMGWSGCNAAPRKWL
jgi:hypothetical protein